MQPQVLIFTPEQAVGRALSAALAAAGIDVTRAVSWPALLRTALETHPAGVVVDARGLPAPAAEALQSLGTAAPGAALALYAANDPLDGLRGGELLDAGPDPVAAAGRIAALATRLHAARPVADDPASRRVLQLAHRVAGSGATVMITGESGVGKECYARFVHAASSRVEGPFVAVNCAAIPEHMLEALLFGYEKGAFTGATDGRPGKFEQAQGGTLLLDEITEMELGLQAKILRVLQEREVERLGGRRAIALDVRVLATSNRDLREAVTDGLFREDLYYRLNVLPLHIPALRERPGDIQPLARALLARHGGTGMTLAPCAEDRLVGHDWPGNVRELENVIQRAVVLSLDTRVLAGELQFETMQGVPGPGETTYATDGVALGGRLRDTEHRLILDALREERGCRKDAAARLGISPRTLRYKLARIREAGVAIP